MSLYDKLGGEDAVAQAVDLFYKKIIEDDRVNGFFEGVDMGKQIRMQQSFVSMALGGPNKYSGRAMKEAHQRLVSEKGLNEDHFDIIVSHLGAALKDLGVKDDLIGQAAEVVNSVRDQVLGRQG